MTMNYQTATKKSLKIAGAFVAATGVVALSAVVASGAAVGAVVEGFKSAGSTVKKILDEKETITKEETEDIRVEEIACNDEQADVETETAEE